MSKDHAEYLTDEQIAAEVERLKREIEEGKISEDEAERDAYFTDPANAEEIDQMFARMKLVEDLYKARHDAGLTQQEVADRMGAKQSYVAELERGRKNVTLSTLVKYAAACGKKVAITML